jgi:MFS superfamily sulfate permease-like transporter
LIHEIPLAALAAMLVFTGFRLASPHEFYKTFLIGWEQLVVFCTTLLVTLATDLLIGVAAGIAVKFGFHLYHGVPLRSLFLPYLDVSDYDKNTYLVEARDSAVFSNWVLLKVHLVHLGIEGKKDVIVDMSHTVFVDHTVMENLHALEREFEAVGQKLTIIGFDEHVPLSEHELSARRRVKVGS